MVSDADPANGVEIAHQPALIDLDAGTRMRFSRTPAWFHAEAFYQLRARLKNGAAVSILLELPDRYVIACLSAIQKGNFHERSFENGR